MCRVALFAEDYGHEQFLTALIDRLSCDYQVPVRPRTSSARGGIMRVHHELAEFLTDLQRQPGSVPDMILVATDANCKKYGQRRAEIAGVVSRFNQFEPLAVYAVPDPHIERWMLVDPNAFKAVFGKGCTVPALKCERRLYKRQLLEAIRAAGIMPPAGGMEYAADIVGNLDLVSVEMREPSFQHLIGELRSRFQQWRGP